MNILATFSSPRRHTVLRAMLDYARRSYQGLFDRTLVVITLGPNETPSCDLDPHYCGPTETLYIRNLGPHFHRAWSRNFLFRRSGPTDVLLCTDNDFCFERVAVETCLAKARDGHLAVPFQPVHPFTEHVHREIGNIHPDQVPWLQQPTQLWLHELPWGQRQTPPLGGGAIVCTGQLYWQLGGQTEATIGWGKEDSIFGETPLHCGAPLYYSSTPAAHINHDHLEPEMDGVCHPWSRANEWIWYYSLRKNPFLRHHLAPRAIEQRGRAWGHQCHHPRTTVADRAYFAPLLRQRLDPKMVDDYEKFLI